MKLSLIIYLVTDIIVKKIEDWYQEMGPLLAKQVMDFKNRLERMWETSELHAREAPIYPAVTPEEL